ncbi:MAG: tetratricopeptide repeat protein [Myxococcota bacterium]
MLRTALRCNGLDRDGVAARVEAMLRSRGVDHPDEWAALTEVIAPRAASWTKAPGGPAGLRFGSPTERYVTVRRLFQALVLERPIVVWLDDVQHGLDALRFALYLLDYPARHPLPVLIVLTVTDDGLAPRTRRLGDESTLLAELVEHDRVERVDVGPLPVEDRPTLIRSLLGLAPALSVRIDDRTAGNPQFAVQLVADWVQRGVITSGPDGYTLRLDEDLPADLHAMWATRIERALAARSDAEVRALELAAVLGTGVDPAEWKAACAEAGDADPSPAVVELLVEHQLATCGPAGPGGGWRFAHPAVRDALEARARRAGRLAALHALCADVLADETHVPGDDHLPERVGRHRLYGDDPEGALSTLFDAAHARLRAGDLAIADELLDLRDTALERSSVPNADVRWGDGWLVRHEIATRQGRWEDADRWLDQIDGAATLFGWDAVRRRVRCLRARRDRVQGRYAKAVAASIDVEQEAAKRGDRALMADARLEIAQALLGSGDVPGAERWGRLALQEYEAQSDKLGTAEAWRVLGETAKEAGDPAEALALLRQAEAAFAERGQRYKVAIAVNGQGDVARAMGDLDQAASLYRRARGLLKAIGSRAWVFPAYNAGLIHLARGDHRRARETLEVAMAEFTRQGNSGALANANLALVLCAAFDEQWLLFDDHLAEADGLLRQTGFCDEDTARLATQAGTASERLQQGPRAVAAYELGQRLWTTLGREAELDAVSRALARVRPG